MTSARPHKSGRALGVERLSPEGRALVEEGLAAHWTHKTISAELAKETGEKISTQAISKFKKKVFDPEQKFIRRGALMAKQIANQYAAIGRVLEPEELANVLSVFLVERKEELAGTPMKVLLAAQRDQTKLSLDKEKLELDKRRVELERERVNLQERAIALRERVQERLQKAEEKAKKKKGGLTAADIKKIREEIYGLISSEVRNAA